MTLVTWNRIEPVNQADTIELGLAARIADPLWLLGRQWQIGELVAEDAGSPISATVEATEFPIDRLVVGNHVRPLDASLPLEAHVEPEPPAPPDLRMRLCAGRDLATALLAANLPAAAQTLPTFAAPAPTRDRTGAALIRALGSRAIDAEVIAHEIAEHGIAATASALDASSPAVQTVLATWLAGYQRLTGRAAPSAWVNDLAMYQFSVAAGVGDRDIFLDALAYRGGTLDWCELAARAEPRAAPAATGVVLPPRTVLPSPLEFAGGPARRFFELERGGASFSLLAGAPQDVGTALLVEVMLVFGGDWFIVPARMSVGSLGRIDRITVRDTFGRETAITQRMRDPGWRMFECSGDPLAADLLPVLPTISTGLESAAIERVSLIPDEGANVVWAVEEIIADDVGLPRRLAPESPQIERGENYAYVPFLAPPETWFPLVRRQQVFLSGATVHGEAPPRVPRSQLLSGWPAVRFLSSDVTTEGLQIERRWQLAVARDRSRALWMSRIDRVARGPASSGVMADPLIPPA